MLSCQFLPGVVFSKIVMSFCNQFILLIKVIMIPRFVSFPWCFLFKILVGMLRLLKYKLIVQNLETLITRTSLFSAQYFQYIVYERKLPCMYNACLEK